MAKRTPLGERSLKLIRASGSTARVLNLTLAYERFGQTPDYNKAPLMQTHALNTALILKHVVRPHEREYFDAPPMTTTKVILPFARSELQLGGRVLLYGERLFERSIREFCGTADPGRIAADLEMLEVLNSLPSFDPFLMRERLRHSGLEPARCYFDLSEADVRRMREFVAKEITQLVDLAYANGGGASRDLARKLADKLMTDETAKTLDGLRVALQLSEDDYREGVFSWKGFLYYRWLASAIFPRAEDLKRSVVQVRINGADKDAQGQLKEMRRQFIECFDNAMKRVTSALDDYSVALAGLSGGEAIAFRNFLLKAPSLFIPIGEAIGVIQHMESFWRFRFPPGMPQILTADEAFDIYGDFLTTLTGIADLQHAPQSNVVMI